MEENRTDRDQLKREFMQQLLDSYAYRKLICIAGEQDDAAGDAGAVAHDGHPF